MQPLPTGRFGLVLRRSGGEFRPSYADLGSAFQLTRGEIRVLLQLADGLSAAQAAEQLCVSTETVRTHIRNLYAKLAVKNREGLLSRIRAYQM
ncbi:MAG TPA: helix-turn-helix transcriptional regulator [Allosphingosinicella sp.]